MQRALLELYWHAGCPRDVWHTLQQARPASPTASFGRGAAEVDAECAAYLTPEFGCRRSCFDTRLEFSLRGPPAQLRPVC